MTPRPSEAVRIRSAISSCGSPKNSCRRRPRADQAAQQHPDGRASEPADPLELAPCRLRLEEGEQRAQVGQVEQREALLVRVVEDEREALLLRLVRLEDLGEQLRARSRTRSRARDARADPAEREVLDREAARLERASPSSPMRFSAGPAGLPGAASPETSPLTSAAKTATPASESCSAIVCRVIVLPVPVAPATRPWRFIIRSGTLTTASVASSPRGRRGRGR